MELCDKKYNWKYIFTQKTSRQKLLDESYEWIKSGEGAEQIPSLCKERGTGCYANHVEKVAGKKEVMNVFEYEYEDQKEDGKRHTIRFCWITNIELTKFGGNDFCWAWKMENRKRRI